MIASGAAKIAREILDDLRKVTPHKIYIPCAKYG